MAFERKICSESIVIVQPDTARDVQFTLGTFIGARRRASPTKAVHMEVENYSKSVTYYREDPASGINTVLN